ncbi:hypothetical protein DLM76_20460 [Leptospira yasudae]|uniref:hypothetical protein n=1 Tax=Leptospira yasudae TaxID=2202201 RepID=UPI000E59C98A|nr:hypothetical protein [Leptospira yasudae]RHX90239.1 hypothetical protein DLM76_20460 [Leptospira yasudae]
MKAEEEKTHLKVIKVDETQLKKDLSELVRGSIIPGDFYEFIENQTFFFLESPTVSLLEDLRDHVSLL